MAQQKRLQVEFKRHPVRDLDATDVDAARTWIKTHVAARVGMHARVNAVMRYLRQGAEEVASLDGLVELGDEGVLGAFFRSAGQREGILRRFREGELLVRDDEGSLRRAACILELVERDGQAPAWWCAHRFFGEGAAGVGNFHGPWIEREGDDLDALDEPFRGWVDPGNATIDRTEFGGFVDGPKPDFDLRMAMLPPPSAPPANAGELAVGIGRSMDTEILKRGLTCHLVFVLNDTAVERFELRGELPCDLDDLIRNLVLLGDTIGVALVVPGVFTLPNGENKRAVYTLAEVRGQPQRARRVTPLELAPGQAPRLLGELVQTTELAEGAGWLGVKPVVELGLFPTGIDGLGGGGPLAES